MQLTLRGLLLLAPALLFMALTPLLPGSHWISGLWLIVWLSVLLADLRLMPAAADWQLTRRHDDRLSLATANTIEITVRLRGGRSTLPIWVRDDPPPNFQIAEADRLLAGDAIPGQSISLEYIVTPPRRGDYKFGDLYLRWQAPLGLVRRQARFAAVEPVKVYPNLVDVKKYDLLLRRNRLWELGLRNTKIFGSGTEFERLRDYLPDDEYRRINWKATARRGKPISTEYETERSQNLMALLDVGRMMRSPVGAVAKLDYAINAVLLLAYVSAQKGDKIGLLTFADTPQSWLSPRGGKRQFHRMLEQLYAVEGAAVEPDYNAAFGYLAAKQSKRSLILVFTDLTGSITTEALVAQMSRLRRTHLPLLVTIGDPTVQRLARQPIVDSASLYQRTVAGELLEERALVLEKLNRVGVHTLDVPADELSIAVINRYLELKARVRL